MSAKLGLPRPPLAAESVSFIQRFGASLNLNLQAETAPHRLPDGHRGCYETTPVKTVRGMMRHCAV